MGLRTIVRRLWAWLDRLLNDHSIDERPTNAGRRHRAVADHLPCPQCQRDVAYSAATRRTARHRCQGRMQQVDLWQAFGSGKGYASVGEATGLPQPGEG